MATIGSINVRFGADIADFVSDMNRANKLTQKTGMDMKRVMVAAGAAIGSAIVGAGAAVTKMTNDVLKDADRFQKLTDRIGGSTEAFSQLEHVAEKSGVRFETLTMGLQRMTRRIGEVAFAGKGEAKGALEELGLSAQKLAELPLDKQFEAVAEELSKVANKSDQTRLAMKLFDSEGVALVQTMGKGAAGIQALRMEADRLGKTITSETAASAVRFNDQMTVLSAKVDGFKTQVASALIPTLTGLANQFIKVGDGQNFAAESGQFLSNVLKVVVSGAIILKNVFEAAAHIVVGFGVAIVESFKGINDAVGAFLWPAINAIKALAEGDFDAALDAAKQFGSGFGAALSEAGNKISTVLKDQIGEAIGDVTEGVEGVMAVWDESADVLENEVIPAYKKTDLAIEKTTAQLEAEKKAASDAAKAQQQLVQRFKELRASLNPLQALTKRYQRDLKVLESQIDETSYTTDEFKEDSKKLREEFERQREELEGLTSEYENLLDELYPLQALQRDLERDVQLLHEAFDDERLTVEELNEALAILHKRHEEAARSAQGLKEETNKAFDNLGKAIERMFDDISRNGELTFDGLLVSFTGIIDEMVDAIEKANLNIEVGAEGSAGSGLFGNGSVFGSEGFFGSSGGRAIGGAAAAIVGGLLINEFGDEFATNYAEIGSQIGTIVGSIIGSFIPVIGTALGGAIGSVLGAIDGIIFGKLFGRDLELEIGGRGAQGADDNDDAIRTALGEIVSLRAQGGFGRFGEDGTPGFEVANALRGFDEAMAGILSDSQIERVVESLKTWRISLEKDSVTIENILESRFAHIVGNFSGLVKDYVDQFEGLEQKIEAFQIVLQALNMLTESVNNFVRSNPAAQVAAEFERMRLTSTDVLSGIGDTLRAMMDAFDGTPQQMQLIAATMDARYQAELEYLTAIQRLVMTLIDSIESQQDRIRSSIDTALNGEKSFEQLFAEAQELFAGIGSAGSPEALQQMVEQIQSLIDAAFGKLDSDSLVSGGEQLLAFLDEVLAAATERAGALREDAIAEGDDLRTDVEAFAAAFQIPMDANIEAVNGVQSEIAQQTQILVGESREQQGIQQETNGLLAEVRDVLAALTDDDQGRRQFVSG